MTFPVVLAILQGRDADERTLTNRLRAENERLREAGRTDSQAQGENR